MYAVCSAFFVTAEKSVVSSVRRTKSKLTNVIHKPSSRVTLQLTALQLIPSAIHTDVCSYDTGRAPFVFIFVYFHIANF